MTQETLFDQIKNAGLTPVPIKQEGDAEEILNYFDGSLEAYLAAAKAIGATAMFVEAYPLEEEQFFYSLETGEESDEEDAEMEFEEVDLAEYSPELAKYKERLDEIYCFFLVAKGGAADLCFTVDQTWLADFENEIDAAEGMAMLAQQKGKGPRSK